MGIDWRASGRQEADDKKNEHTSPVKQWKAVSLFWSCHQALQTLIPHRETALPVRDFYPTVLPNHAPSPRL
jgi:hypothetical protein